MDCIIIKIENEDHEYSFSKKADMVQRTLKVWIENMEHKTFIDLCIQNPLKIP